MSPCRAALIAATSIFLTPIIAVNARFASPPPAAIASVSKRGVICQGMPDLLRLPPQHCSRAISSPSAVMASRCWQVPSARSKTSATYSNRPADSRRQILHSP